MVELNCAEPLQQITWILVKQGLLSEEPVNTLRTIKLWLHLNLWMFILILEANTIVKAVKLHDISTMNQMICMLISAITVLAKQVTTVTNKKYVLSVLDDLRSHTFNTHNSEQNRHVQFIARISKFLWKYYLIIGIVFFLTTCLLPFIFNMKMIIPPPFNMGRFIIFYKIVQSVMIFYMSVNSVVVDVFYMTTLGLCGAQLQILQEKLVSITGTSKEKCDVESFEQSKVTGDGILKECVILHEAINRYVKKLSIILSFPLFIQYTSGCIIVCNTVLQMTIVQETNVSNILTLTAYTAATFGQLVLYHWFGNEIIFWSDKIVESCYLSEWYNLAGNSQKMLILLMERAKKPLTIELYNLISISLNSLGLIIRWSYSLFALLKVTYN